MYRRIFCGVFLALSIFFFGCTQENTQDTSSPENSAALEELNQNMAKDTTLAGKYIESGKQFANKAEYDSAIANFQKAIPIFEKKELWEKAANCYNQLGDVYRKTGAYNQAMIALETALKIEKEKLGETHLEVSSTYSIIGSVKYRLGHIDEALDFWRKSLEIRAPKLGEKHPEVASIYNNYGIAYKNKGDFDLAMKYYHKALEIRIEAYGEHHSDVAASYYNMGNIYNIKGDYERALNTFEKVLKIDKALKGEMHPHVAQDYRAIGRVYFLKGDYQQALNYQEKALSIAKEKLGEEHLEIAFSYSSIGHVFEKKGDYDQALQYFNRSLSIYKAQLGEKHNEVAGSYKEIGDVYELKGDFDQAIHYYNKTLAILKDFPGKSKGLAKVYNSFARIYYNKGEYGQAYTFFEKGGTILRQILGENHLDVANHYTNIALIFAETGEYEKAIENTRKSLAIHRKVAGDKTPYIVSDYNNLGAFYKASKRYDQSLTMYQLALQANAAEFSDANVHVNPQLKNIISEVDMLQTLEFKAQTLALKYYHQTNRLEDLEASVATYQLASQLIRQIRSGYKAEDSKLFIAERAAGIYDQAIQTTRQLFRVTNNPVYQAKTFEFAEKSKGKIFLEAMIEAKAKSFSGLPDSLLNREKQLRIDLAFYERKLSEVQLNIGIPNASGIEVWQNKVFDLKQTYYDLLEQFENDYPAYYRLKYELETTSIEEIQIQLLDANTVLIEYFLGKDSIFIFTITPDQYLVTSTSRPVTLKEQISSLRTAITQQDIERFIKNAYQVYQTLLAPVNDVIENKNLIIIPEGVLNLIPFEALLTGNSIDYIGIKDYRKLPFLVKTNEISYSYSATLLLETMKNRKPKAQQQYLAYAPVFSGGIPQGTRGAAFIDANRAVDSTRGFNSTYLPASKDEVLGIKDVFIQKAGFFNRIFGGPADVLLENEANEDQLKSQRVDEYRYVHFATHGLINETNPQLSGLVLAQDSTLAEDGILYLGEVYNLNLNADLVVLSACETGLGKIARGEGLIGLTRGFLYAGAQNLLVSLWQVNDASTSQLMIDFYRNMLNGESKPTALREAKLALIENDPKYAGPYYWAPFVLIGK